MADVKNTGTLAPTSHLAGSLFDDEDVEEVVAPPSTTGLDVLKDAFRIGGVPLVIRLASGLGGSVLTNVATPVVGGAVGFLGELGAQAYEAPDKPFNYKMATLEGGLTAIPGGVGALSKVKELNKARRALKFVTATKAGGFTQAAAGIAGRRALAEEEGTTWQDRLSRAPGAMEYLSLGIGTAAGGFTGKKLKEINPGIFNEAPSYVEKAAAQRAADLAAGKFASEVEFDLANGKVTPERLVALYDQHRYDLSQGNSPDSAARMQEIVDAFRRQGKVATGPQAPPGFWDKLNKESSKQTGPTVEAAAKQAKLAADKATTIVNKAAADKVQKDLVLILGEMDKATNIDTLAALQAAYNKLHGESEELFTKLNTGKKWADLGRRANSAFARATGTVNVANVTREATEGLVPGKTTAGIGGSAKLRDGTKLSFRTAYGPPADAADDVVDLVDDTVGSAENAAARAKLVAMGAVDVPTPAVPPVAAASAASAPPVVVRLKPAAPPAGAVSVPAFIAGPVRQKLRGLGFDDAAIDAMTPEEALARLNNVKAAVEPVVPTTATKAPVVEPPTPAVQPAMTDAQIADEVAQYNRSRVVNRAASEVVPPAPTAAPIITSSAEDMAKMTELMKRQVAGEDVSAELAQLYASRTAREAAREADRLLAQMKPEVTPAPGNTVETFVVNNPAGPEALGDTITKLPKVGPVDGGVLDDVYDSTMDPRSMSWNIEQGVPPAIANAANKLRLAIAATRAEQQVAIDAGKMADARKLWLSVEAQGAAIAEFNKTHGLKRIPKNYVANPELLPQIESIRGPVASEGPVAVQRSQETAERLKQHIDDLYKMAERFEGTLPALGARLRALASDVSQGKTGLEAEVEDLNRLVLAEDLAKARLDASTRVKVTTPEPMASPPVMGLTPATVTPTRRGPAAGRLVKREAEVLPLGSGASRPPILDGDLNSVGGIKDYFDMEVEALNDIVKKVPLTMADVEMRSNALAALEAKANLAAAALPNPAAKVLARVALYEGKNGLAVMNKRAKQFKDQMLEGLEGQSPADARAAASRATGKAAREAAVVPAVEPAVPAVTPVGKPPVKPAGKSVGKDLPDGDPDTLFDVNEILGQPKATLALLAKSVVKTKVDAANVATAEVAQQVQEVLAAGSRKGATAVQVEEAARAAGPEGMKIVEEMIAERTAELIAEVVGKTGQKGTTLGSGFGGLQGFTEAMARDPEFAERLLGGAAGAATGYLSAPEDGPGTKDADLAFALAGGLAGAAAPGTLRGVRNSWQGIDGGSLQKAATLATEYGPTAWRTSLLGEPVGLAINTGPSPWGSFTIGSFEELLAGILGGDPARAQAGARTIRGVSNPSKWFQHWGQAKDEALQLIGENERSGGRFGKQLFTKDANVAENVLTIPQRLMSTTDQLGRIIGTESGIPLERLRQMNNTGNPRAEFFKAAENLGRKAPTILLPFYRTAVNAAEGATERFPVLGAAYQFYNKAEPGMNFKGTDVLAQQVISIPGAVAAYQLGANTEPGVAKDLLLARLINNSGGQYGPILALAFVIGQARTSTGTPEGGLRGGMKAIDDVLPAVSFQSIGDFLELAVKGAQGIPLNEDVESGLSRYLPRVLTPGPLSPTFMKNAEGLKRQFDRLQELAPINGSDSLDFGD